MIVGLPATTVIVLVLSIAALPAGLLTLYVTVYIPRVDESTLFTVMMLLVRVLSS